MDKNPDKPVRMKAADAPKPVAKGADPVVNTEELPQDSLVVATQNMTDPAGLHTIRPAE